MATFGGFTTFGQRNDGTSGTSNLGFGSQSAGAAPANSFSFGNLGTATPASGGFGGFTNTAATTAVAPLMFGGQPTNTTASTGFGSFAFGNSGSTVTSVPSGGFGLPLNQGASTLTASSTGFGGFGSTLPASTTSFGGFGNFGSTAPTTSSNTFNFGQGFNNPTTTNTFGTGSTGLFGKPAIGPTPQLQNSNDQTFANLMASLFCPVVYSDERDSIIAKWNQLQAYWGVGSGFYAVGAPPISYTQENVFCKFKAVGYSCLPNSKNEDGFVSFVIDKNYVEVRTLQAQLVDGLFKILGSNSSVSVCVEGLKPSAENKTEVTIYVVERAATGLSRRVPANDLYTFLNNQNVKQQLTSFGIERVIVKVKPTLGQLKLYCDTPKLGIDQVVWQQACKDNPDPEKFIPVPMIGFGELQRRLKYQEEETKVHDNRLKLIGNEINDLQNHLISSEAKIAEHKRKHLELCHRILKVMIKQEIRRKLGLAFQADEEQLRVQLEKIYNDLGAPNQAKGRLNELMAQVRLQKENFVNYVPERYNMDVTLQEELKRHLKKQQEGLNHMVTVLKANFEYLKLVDDKLKEDSTIKQS